MESQLSIFETRLQLLWLCWLYVAVDDDAIIRLLYLGTNSFLFVLARFHFAKLNLSASLSCFIIEKCITAMLFFNSRWCNPARKYHITAASMKLYRTSGADIWKLLHYPFSSSDHIEMHFRFVRGCTEFISQSLRKVTQCWVHHWRRIKPYLCWCLDFCINCQ